MAKKLLGFFNKQKQFEQDVMENGMQYSSFYGDSLRRLKKNKMAMFCACVLILLALMAIFAPLLAPYDPTYQDYSAVLGGPCKAHPFGTDEFGRDILSRIIYGSRVSISIGIVAQIIASIVGVTLGSLAGYYGGWIDSLISRVMEIFQAFPDLIFAMAIMTFMGKGVLNLFIALGLLTWVRTARMIRGSVMQLKEKEYVSPSAFVKRKRSESSEETRDVSPVTVISVSAFRNAATVSGSLQRQLSSASPRWRYSSRTAFSF